MSADDEYSKSVAILVQELQLSGITYNNQKIDYQVLVEMMNAMNLPNLIRYIQEQNISEEEKRRVIEALLREVTKSR